MQIERVAGEIAGPTPGLFDNQRAGGNIPRMEAPFPKGIGSPARHLAQVQGGRPAPSDSMAAQHKGFIVM